LLSAAQQVIAPDPRQHSNAASQLLGYILERVYGTSYENLVKTNITRPLKMDDTSITLTRSQKSHLVKGYDEKGSLMPYTPDKFQAAGALKSSVADMLKYMRWQVAEKDAAVKLSHLPIWVDASPLDYAITTDAHARAI
jgi:D-alanyl-D-alanine-carboxypeptidase/D-alanyl-D-alanine-endopeptidase